MPDLFVATEDKPTRNRSPLITEEQPSVSESADTPSSSLPIQQKPLIQVPPGIDTALKPKPLPQFDDIERKNAFPLIASFWQNPHSIYFDTQQPDERILLFLRRHFVTNVPWITFTLLLLILPPLAFYLLHVVNYPITFLPFPLMQIILILYYLLVLTNAFVNFLDWYYNITIITTERVLDIQLKDLVSKKVSATKISLIQDVDFKQIGTIPSLFNYGDVVMQTAGTLVNFVADAVPNPELVVQIVEGLIGKEKEIEVQGGQNV